MKVKVVQDGNGKDTGVFISMEDWTLLKSNYPDIDHLETTLPEWQQLLLNERLELLSKNPERIKPIKDLFDWVE